MPDSCLVLLSQNICLLEDLKCPTIIGLGSKDSVVPSTAIKKYIELNCKAAEHEDRVDLLWWEGRPHGYCLTPKAVKELVEVVEVQEKRLALRNKPQQLIPRID